MLDNGRPLVIQVKFPTEAKSVPDIQIHSFKVPEKLIFFICLYDYDALTPKPLNEFL